MGATSVPCLKLARVLHGCNFCATLVVGMVVACVKLGLTSVRAYVGPSERLAHAKDKYKGSQAEKSQYNALNNNENSSAKHCTNIQQQERHTWKQ